eukprot:2145689-Prymnesium_polylepis.1
MEAAAAKASAAPVAALQLAVQPGDGGPMEDWLNLGERAPRIACSHCPYQTAPHQPLSGATLSDMCVPMRRRARLPVRHRRPTRRAAAEGGHAAHLPQRRARQGHQRLLQQLSQPQGARAAPRAPFLSANTPTPPHGVVSAVCSWRSARRASTRASSPRISASLSAPAVAGSSACTRSPGSSTGKRAPPST